MSMDPSADLTGRSPRPRRELVHGPSDGGPSRSGNRLLYVGATAESSNSARRIKALAQIGYRVESVNDSQEAAVQSLADRLSYRLSRSLRRPLDQCGANDAILQRLGTFDILYVDKGLSIKPSTLARVKHNNPEVVLIGHHPDDVLYRPSTSKFFEDQIPLYDLFLTTRPDNVADLRRLGCGNPVLIHKSFDPEVHFPSDETGSKATIDVGFVGTYEAERAATLELLGETGISVRIRGRLWEPLARRSPRNLEFLPPVYGKEYCDTIRATKINLGFLRKVHRDQHTSRTMEITASGGFLLAERTEEHQQLFVEGKEAEFFESDTELIEKIQHYLKHDDERRRIADAGARRCRSSDYSYQGQLTAGFRAGGLALPERRVSDA